MPDDERQGDVPDPQIDAVAERIAAAVERRELKMITTVFTHNRRSRP